MPDSYALAQSVMSPDELRLWQEMLRRHPSFDPALNQSRLNGGTIADAVRGVPMPPGAAPASPMAPPMPPQLSPQDQQSFMDRLMTMGDGLQNLYGPKGY